MLDVLGRYGEHVAADINADIFGPVRASKILLGQPHEYGIAIAPRLTHDPSALDNGYKLVLLGLTLG